MSWIVLVLAYILLQGFLMGFMISWKLKGDKTSSKLFHLTGWLLRLYGHCIVFLITFRCVFWLIAMWQFVTLSFSWIIFDIIINIICGFGFWYVDRKGINGFIVKLIGVKALWISRAVLLTISLTLLILNLK